MSLPGKLRAFGNSTETSPLARSPSAPGHVELRLQCRCKGSTPVRKMKGWSLKAAPAVPTELPRTWCLSPDRPLETVPTGPRRAHIPHLGDPLLPRGSQKQPFSETPAPELSGVCTSKKTNDAELYSLQKVGQEALTLKKLEKNVQQQPEWESGEKRQRGGS